MNDLPDGVYFDLPFPDYLALPRLSASGMKKLSTSPLHFWRHSSMDPNQVVKETKSLRTGTALHMLLGEGEEVFFDHYEVKPDKFPPYEGDRTMAELRAMCKEVGVKAAQSKAETWYRLELNSIGKQLISAKELNDLKRMVSHVEGHPEARNIFYGGYPEVTVLWSDEMTGVRLKVRFDYLRPGSSVDIKTIANQFDIPFQRAIIKQLINYNYYVSGALYHEGHEQALRLINTGAVTGDVDQSWLDSFVESPDYDFFFLFIQTGDVNHVALREYGPTVIYLEDNETGDDDSLIFDKGVRTVRACLDQYNSLMAQFGTDQMWDPPTLMTSISNEEFSPYFLDEEVEL